MVPCIGMYYTVNNAPVDQNCILSVYLAGSFVTNAHHEQPDEVSPIWRESRQVTEYVEPQLGYPTTNPMWSPSQASTGPKMHYTFNMYYMNVILFTCVRLHVMKAKLQGS